jgi:hypothetical protein
VRIPLLIERDTMSSMFGRATVVVALACGVARAGGDPAALIEQGEQLAKHGEFTHAIDVFKQADVIQPSAANACRIGLAYTRRELWSQAEIFFERCRKRATAADPTPDWLPDAETQLVQKLTDVGAASIAIHVEPALAAARVTVSSFPPDEQFEPRTIHLQPGDYTIIASAPGREPVHASLTVVPKTAQIVTLVLPPPPPPPPPPPTRAERLGTWMLYGAAGIAVAGAGFHLLAAHERGQLDDARTTNDPVEWDRHAGSFEAARALTIGCYGAAVVVGVIGLVLRRHHPEAPFVTGVVGDHTAMIGLEWRR